MIRQVFRPLLLSLALALPLAAQTAPTPPPDAMDGILGADTGTTDLQILDAAGVDLDAYLWLNRVLVVFADTPADPRFIKQMQMIAERPRDLVEREVVVLTDTDPAARTEPRQQLRPRGFALVMVDKDGQVKLRKPSPWSTREIARSIDKTPLRREELLERRPGQ